MAVVIKRCNCKGTPAADFQDKQYGEQQRVHNTTLKNETVCTVCGTKTKQ